jgi:hypothetical protein
MTGVMMLAWGGWFMTVINTSSPAFSSLYTTEVTFAKPLVNIEILGKSVGGRKLTIFW